jgi:putative Holliday junction resolvase
MRILAVDPGAKRIGLAISDPTGTIANPLTVIEHLSRAKDATTITEIASQHNAERIVVGQALDIEGEPTFEGRRSARLAAAIQKKTDIPVELWDESGSTQAAQQARRKMGMPRKKRAGHLDEIAATVILQTYLDAHFENARE